MLTQPAPFKRHRFPPDVIRLAVWLYFRFTLSFRDVEEMLAQRGIEVSYETVRCWTLKFGRAFARNLRRSRPKPTGRWHLDEMVVKIHGTRMWLWRAVDDEGEVLDMLVQRRRHTVAALRLLRKLLKRNGIHPESFATEKLLPIEPRSGSFTATIDTERDACSTTIERRTHTWSFDDGSANNRGSSLNFQPRGFSRLTPPSTTTSTFKDT